MRVFLSRDLGKYPPPINFRLWINLTSTRPVTSQVFQFIRTELNVELLKKLET